jgi:alkylation response protein AidB-like acyl-CoA dehydrogenase
VFALQGLGSLPILFAGSPELRARWADAAIAGRAMAAFAMTEREAGSDVAAMATTARRDGDHYVIDGAKTYISNAGIADFYTVFAKTDLAAGSRGVSCFVVPADTPGLRFVRPLVLSAPHPLGEMAFENCRVPVAQRLGEEGKGFGFGLGLRVLDRMRTTVGAAACGMAARALQEALDYARARKQFGKPIAEFQLVQEKLARMATGCRARHARGGDGQVLRDRSGAADRGRCRASTRRRGPHGVSSGGSSLSRGASAAHLRGHDRDPASRDRGPAPAGSERVICSSRAGDLGD